MLIYDYPEWGQQSLINIMLPKTMYELTGELSKIDKVLNDEAIEEPIVKKYKTNRGRPTVPLRVYIRLMFLKFYLCLSYEDLVPAVSKNMMYKNFCRIPIEREIPDATTLMKITTKYGEEIIEEINQKLLKSLVKKKILKGRKLRVDTTVMEANISYPTDASLIYKGVKKLTKLAYKIKKKLEKPAREKTSTLKKLKEDLMSVGKVLHRRNGDKKTEIRKITSGMVEKAKKVVEKAEKLARNLVTETTQDEKLKGNFVDIVEKVNKIIEQTETVNSGGHVEDRIISLDDREARPIVKGKPGKNTEFGYKLQIQENEQGIVTGYQLFKGNPSDKTLVEPVLEQHMNVFAKPPKDIAMDRGYYDKENEQKAYDIGIKNVSIPKSGKKSKKRTEFENKAPFKRLKKWRSGIEGRISYLKRSFGLKKSMQRGYNRSKLWAGFGIFAHNLVRVSKVTS